MALRLVQKRPRQKRSAGEEQLQSRLRKLRKAFKLAASNDAPRCAALIRREMAIIERLLQEEANQRNREEGIMNENQGSYQFTFDFGVTPKEIDALIKFETGEALDRDKQVLREMDYRMLRQLKRDLQRWLMQIAGALVQIKERVADGPL